MHWICTCFRVPVITTARPIISCCSAGDILFQYGLHPFDFVTEMWLRQVFFLIFTSYSSLLGLLSITYLLCCYIILQSSSPCIGAYCGMMPSIMSVCCIWPCNSTMKCCRNFKFGENILSLMHVPDILSVGRKVKFRITQAN